MFPTDSVAAAPPDDVAASPSLDEVEAVVAELCGTINVATAALVDVVAGLDARGDWAAGGYRSLEHWMMVQCGVSPGRAQGLVQVAKRAGELPETLAKFREGALSEDQVRPIARHVPAGYEASVADFAQYATANQVARTARSYSFPKPEEDSSDDSGDDEDERNRRAEQEQREERERQERQSVRFGFNPDGKWSQTADLPGHDGALVQKALEAARDEIFRERRGASDTPDEEVQVTWADALVRMAEHALAHIGDGKDSRNRDRHQVLWHIRPDDKSGEQAWLHLGPAISGTIGRYLSCDCHLRVVLENDHGTPVNVGRKHRITPDHTRRVVEDRDRGCRFPGCTNTRFVDCHHLVHWEDGGVTDTHNLCCLCKLHHRLLHLGYISITGNADQPHGLEFRNQHGRVIPTGPTPVPPTKPPPKGKWVHPTGEHLDTACVYFAETA